jgi:uncharacterized damage-inducible protein DinB
MHSHELFVSMLDYDRWANRRVAEAFRGDHVPARARELLGHVLLAQHLWCDRVEGRSTTTTVEGDPTVRDPGSEIDRAHDRLAALLSREDEASLDRRIDHRNLRGDEHSVPLREILLHVLDHGVHHRAQIASSLNEAGLTPPRIDFIVYAREREEAP